MESNSIDESLLLPRGNSRVYRSRIDTRLSFASCYDPDEPRIRARTFHVGCGQKLCMTILVATVLLIAILWSYSDPFRHQLKNMISFDSGTLTWFCQYGSIPVVAAIVGWGTNAVAISMTFYPLEFVGCCPSVEMFGMPLCGWQGIIPSNVRRMAGQAVELATTKLFDASAAMDRLDVNQIVNDMRPALEKLAPKIIETVASENAPQIWAQLSRSVKNEIVEKCLENSTQAISGMMGGGNTDIEGGPELKDVLVNLLAADKGLVNDIFLKVAGKEYAFIRQSGFYLGFIFGLGQMWLWTKFDRWWVLPIAGFVVGYLTNFVALKCIFNPIEPVYVCGFKFHGLFLKRQGEVAEVYADLFSSRVLNSHNILLGTINDERSDVLFAMLEQNVQDGIDSIAKNLVLSKRVARKLIGSQKYDGIKERVSGLIKADIQRESFLDLVTPVLDEAMDVRATLERSMNDLSSHEFADMLLPAFQEGELKLIVIGGFLGAVVGMIQALLQVPDQFGL
eukprot:TRINITY_DN44505_c0_g1_i1.p1 TRINITY_DN44505_c0_g1~~TRINITY_DN44505_c0_g1_i1.p1  ORF type:complete len:515 (-),score=79.22 TRINITY_DN44505_c0_g1_i1:71-1594(-)